MANRTRHSNFIIFPWEILLNKIGHSNLINIHWEIIVQQNRTEQTSLGLNPLPFTSLLNKNQMPMISGSASKILYHVERKNNNLKLLLIWFKTLTNLSFLIYRFSILNAVSLTYRITKTIMYYKLWQKRGWKDFIPLTH